MAIRKGNVMLQVSVPKEIVESMDIVCKGISEKLKRKVSKGNLITDIYVQWLEFQGKQIENTLKKEVKEKC